MFDVNPYTHEIERLCLEFGIRRLEFFGSAVSEEFDKESDVDCLIEFEKSGGNYFDRYFDLKYALEAVFDRKVDLVVDSAIRNPYFREAVDASRQVVYAA